MLGAAAGCDPLLRSLEAAPFTLADRVEHHFRVRAPDGFLGALPNLVFAYRRSHPTGRPRPTGLAGFVGGVWGVERPAEALGLVPRKVGRRLGGGLARLRTRLVR